MKRLFTGLLVTVALSIWWLPTRAQAVPNRDSAAYYFELGAGFMEDRRQPEAARAEGRRRAMDRYSQSIAFDSSYYWSYRNLGYCHENFGEYELALADYTRAVRASLRSGEADAARVRYNCIELCLTLQKWAEAEDHCSALLANAHTCSDPVRASCSRVWRDRADVRVHLKKYPEAQQGFLRYQRQVVLDIAEEQQQLAALARAHENAPPLTQRESRQNRKYVRKQDRISATTMRGIPREKELTTLKQLEEEARMVTLKLARLEKMVKP